jgi:hypothetical protein
MFLKPVFALYFAAIALAAPWGTEDSGVGADRETDRTRPV